MNSKNSKNLLLKDKGYFTKRRKIQEVFLLSIFLRHSFSIVATSNKIKKGYINRSVTFRFLGEDNVLMKKTLMAAAIIVPAISFGFSAAQAAKLDIPTGNYVSDPAHTNLLWSIKHFGLSNYYGRFDRIEAKLDLDAANVEKSVLNVTIDPKSVDTNYPETPNTFNEEIAGEMFFDAAKYDKITYQSTSIKLTGEKTGKVTGNLTFHGVTKPVVLNVTLNGALPSHPMTKKPAIGFSATGVIKRSDFGVSELEGPLSDDVNLTIEAEFKQAQ